MNYIRNAGDVRSRFALRVSTALVAMSCAQVVSAQDIVADSAPTAPDSEIVVTAQKRAELITNVPISISALSEAQIRRRGVDDFSKLARLIPSLSFTDIGSGRTQVNIRGMTSSDIRRDDPLRSETVGIYFGEIPLSTGIYSPDLDFFDASRIEILRGPQGTLYGAGSLAGTIKVVPTEADLEKLQFKAEAGLSNTDHGGWSYAARGAFNVPLVTDRAALRLVAYRSHDAGFIDNIAPGGRRNANDADREGARVTLRLKPSDNVTLTPGLIYQVSKTGGQPQQDLIQQTFPIIGGLPIPTGDYQQWRRVRETTRDRTLIASFVIDADLGGASITSSSSYVDRAIDVVNDFTGFVNAFDFVRSNLIGPTPIIDGKDFRTFNQELRVSTHTDGPFDAIGGIFYTRTEQTYNQTVLSPGIEAAGIPTDLFGGSPGLLFRSDYLINTRQFALFGEANYKLTDKIVATMGLRWFDVSQGYTVQSRGFFAGDIINKSVSSTEQGFNPKFLLSYKPRESIMLSAQASRGFRLGGPNDTIPVSGALSCAADLARLGLSGAPNSFKSENAWNYELNAKSSWLNRRLQINAALFYIDYRDLQIDVDLSCGYRIALNAAKARSQGGELEVFFQPSSRLTLSGGLSYTDARLRSNLPAGNGQKGDRLPFAPKLSFSLSGRYTQPLSEMLSGYVDLSYQHRSSSPAFYNNNFLATSVHDPLGNKLQAYGIFNIRLGFVRGPWELAIFADNVFDRRAITYIERQQVTDDTPSGALRFGSINRPRTVGLKLSTSL